MAVAGPRREDEEQPRVAARADLVALTRAEDVERAGAARGGRAAGRDVDLALHHDEMGALVDLVVLQRLAGGQEQRDGARLAARRIQDRGAVRLDGVRAQVPVLHARDATSGDLLRAARL